MTHFDINQFRDADKILMPKGADVDSAFTFYYDETNNFRKFHIRKGKFNNPFESNFVLGGIVCDESKPDIKGLFGKLNLDSGIKDVKFRNLASGDFLSCLSSPNLNCFLRYLLENNIYVHYSTVNLLYYSLVDIVDSAYVNSETAMQLGYGVWRLLKDNLYKLAKLEINSIVKLFHRFEYPNIKKKYVLPFINALFRLLKKYENMFEFHVWLTILRQIMEESKEAKSLPFVMDEEDYVLLNNFSDFYLRPIYLFKNSTHIFDKEDTIEAILSEFIFYDGDKVLKSYSFEDSKENLYIQASDIFVGLVGKLSAFINTHSHADIEMSIQKLSGLQLESLDIYLKLVKKCENKNAAFLHSIDSLEEMSKLVLLGELRSI